MLYDIIIRILGAVGLAALICADGITIPSVVMSVCVLLVFEMSLLADKKTMKSVLSMLSFASAGVYLILVGAGDIILKLLILVVFAGLTFVSVSLYEKSAAYQTQLHRIRDDSFELESALKSKNRALLSEQDQQVHLATLAERNRIAREIHDNVGHLLSRAILLVGAILTVNQDEKIAPQLKMLSETLDESMEKMRSSVHDLHDDSIDLEKNIGDILAELKDFNVTTDLDLDGVLPTEIKLSVIGILKEAVTNILKHSDGDAVSVILHQNYGFCTLSITDNGSLSREEKLRISSESYDGIGLSNIKNRAASMGGEAYFYLNDGFTVFARLPFERDETERKTYD